MPKVYNICSHERRRDIDRALLNGDGYRHVAGRYGVSKSAVERHKPHIARAVERAQAKREDAAGLSLLQKIERLEARVETLYSDAVELLAKAKQAGDTRAAVLAVNGVRNVIAEGRQLIELLAELKGEIDRRPQVSLQVLAPLLIQAPAPCPIEVRVDVARRLQELDKTLEIDAATGSTVLQTVSALT